MPAAVSMALLAERIAAELGLSFGRGRMDELRRGLAAASRDLGLAGEDACVNWLLAMPWTEAQVRILASHLTVGETYFFRDAPALDAFARHILPEVLQRRRAQGRRCLRVWSAGCCTGEEPYSIAILVQQALPDLAEWDVTIAATDINPRFLEKARAGQYGEWSFRGTPAGLRQQYFERTPEGHYRVNAATRAMVSFAELNLARETYPCTVNGTDGIDVIFCRNVLMYFDDEQARAVARRLQSSLADGGWLIVSPSEASSAAFPQLDPVNFESAVMFRNDAAGRRADTGTDPGTAAEPSAQLPEGGLFPIPIPVFDLADPREAAESSAFARQTARALADQGRLGEALAWCERWIAVDKLDPWAYYVRGAVLAEQGDANAARQALQRCIYLRPGFVLAHLALGQVARGLGDTAATTRHLAVAAQLLRAFRPDDPVPDADGLTAGRLQEAFKALAAEGQS